MSNSSIIVCGQRYDVGQRVITFQDDPLINAYTMHRTDKPSEIYPYQPAKGMGAVAYRFRPRRLMGADRSLGRLREIVRQFVVHHDGCMDSRQCFQVLHNERGLSVHFLIDNDGTILQTLDLVDCAFHAAGVNEISVGVELTNRGDALRFPDVYRGARKKLTCSVHGHQFLAYEYTKAQLDAMISLGKTLQRLLPNLPPSFPAGSDGEPSWTAMGDPRQYAGYLGHYHVTGQKWDPGPFDFKWFASKLRGRISFPLAPSGAKPELPDSPEKLEELARGFYDNNETEGEGGYYPVGPYGQSRLWHGGVHLRADEDTPLYAPFGGKIVAARMTGDCAIGSRNFVLIKHEMAVGGQNVKFWTLLFHLAEEQDGRDAPAWWKKASRTLGDEASSLDIEVGAGELVGHVGEAGPPGRFEGQVHLEIMSAEDLGEKIEPGFWTVLEGAGMGRFCQAPLVLDRIDKAKDGVLTRAEVLNFFRQDPRREEFHKIAAHHVSEWADENDWQVALNKSPDFADLPEPQRRRMFTDQIQPVLWWTDEIADAAGLPSDKVVWTYHPITFLIWIHDRMRSAGVVAGHGITDASTFNGKAAPTGIKDDFDSTEGFTDDEDAVSSKKLELEDLANGYPDEK